MAESDKKDAARREVLADVMDDGNEAVFREGGREFLVAFYAALRNLRLYPLENVQVQRALDEVESSARVLLDVEPELEVRVAGEFIFVNSTRLRLALDNYSTFSHILTTLHECGIGAFHANAAVERREWQIFLALLLSSAAPELEGDALEKLEQKLDAAGVTHIDLEPPWESTTYEDAEARKRSAKRTYEQSVAVTQEVINSVRMGRTASVKKVKRAVQNIVDQVLQNETSIVGLTTIRDYDRYTFNHSVNVCIFSVSMGKRLGLTKLQLYDLGLAALLHDVGKSRVPLEVLNKDGALTDDEWGIIQAHPWLGVLTLFGLRGYGEIPYRGIIVAFEHHMKNDLTGYPRTIRPRDLSVFSKVVAVADGFDAATSRRVYQTVPIQPDQVLREMWENRRRGYDPVLVKSLINLLGIYPVGTCVVLDTYELAIVHAANPDVSQLNRPVVRVLCTAEGSRLDPGPLVDLAETDDSGSFKRSIIKVTDPAKYGLNPSDYFV
jgi:HD-GYP domain-containing protein (c-di-GMP phosphodiesterase class II)